MDKLCQFLQKRGLDDVLEKFDKEKVDLDVLKLMNADDLKEYLPKHGDRIAVLNFVKDLGRKKTIMSTKDKILTRLRKKIQNDKETSSESDSSAESAKTGKKIPKKIKLKGNENAKKIHRRLDLGWIINENNEELTAHQVKHTNGGGTRKLTVDKNFKKENIIEEGKKIFFPKGKNRYGKVADYNFDVWDFAKDPMESDTSIEEIYETSKVKILRLYIVTSLKLKNESCTSVNQSCDIDSSGNELYDPCIEPGNEGKDILSQAVSPSGICYVSSNDEEQHTKNNQKDPHMYDEKQNDKDKKKADTSHDQEIFFKEASFPVDFLELSYQLPGPHDITLPLNTPSKNYGLPLDSGPKTSLMSLKGRSQRSSFTLNDGSHGSQSSSLTLNDRSQSSPLTLNDGSQSSPLTLNDGSRSQSSSLTLNDQSHGSQSSLLTLNDGSQSSPLILNIGSQSSPLPMNAGSHSTSLTSTDRSQSSSSTLNVNSHISSSTIISGSQSSLLPINDNSHISSLPLNIGSVNLSFGSQGNFFIGDIYGQGEAMEIEGDTTGSRILKIHSGNVLNELIAYFKDPSILNDYLSVIRYTGSTTPEKGEGTGLLRDIYTEFWCEFYLNCTIGCNYKVPELRHDYQEDEWEAVGRILMKGFEDVGYFPVGLSPSLIEECLYSKCHSNLLECYFLHIPQSEVSCIKQALVDFDAVDKDELIDIFDAHQCHTIPNAQNLKPLILEIANKEMIQDPRFVVDVWKKILQPLSKKLSIKELNALYESATPTTKKILDLINFAEAQTPGQAKTIRFLKTFIKELDDETIKSFLRYCTGSDLITKNIEMTKIHVEFVHMEENIRRPIARTCGCILELSDNFKSFPQFRAEFSNVLKSGILIMDII